MIKGQVGGEPEFQPLHFHYSTGNRSSYGAENCWDNGSNVQCFEVLRGCGSCGGSCNCSCSL